jgi:hypothetical protein
MSLDHQATAVWGGLTDEHGASFSASGRRDFETLKEAIRFVIENLASYDQKTAFIQTDSKYYPIEKIRKIYESAEFKSDLG